MVKVPKDFKDYDDDDPNVDRHKMRYNYWGKLTLLREEFYRTKGIDRDNTNFLQWVEDTYGFRPILNEAGITDDYLMVDEKKYTYFILKYG